MEFPTKEEMAAESFDLLTYEKNELQAQLQELLSILNSDSFMNEAVGRSAAAVRLFRFKVLDEWEGRCRERGCEPRT